MNFSSKNGFSSGVIVATMSLLILLPSAACGGGPGQDDAKLVEENLERSPTDVAPIEKLGCTDNNDGVLKLAGVVPLSESNSSVAAGFTAGVELALAEILTVDSAKLIEWHPTQVELAEISDSGGNNSSLPAGSENFDAFLGPEPVSDRNFATGSKHDCFMSWSLLPPMAESNSSGLPSNAGMSFSTLPANDSLFDLVAENLKAAEHSKVVLLESEIEADQQLLNVEVNSLVDSLDEHEIKIEKLKGAAEVAAWSKEQQGAIGEVLVVVGFENLVALSEPESGFESSNVGEILLVDPALWMKSLTASVALPAKLLELTTVFTTGPNLPGGFSGRVITVDPDLVNTNAASYAFDAVMLTVLASDVANSDNSTTVANHIRDVSSGGEKCGSYKQCRALVDEGVDIDYEGVSGPVPVGPSGAVQQGSYLIAPIAADGLTLDLDSAQYEVAGS